MPIMHYKMILIMIVITIKLIMILQPIAFIVSSTVIVNDEKLKSTITLYTLQYIRDEIRKSVGSFM